MTIGAASRYAARHAEARLKPGSGREIDDLLPGWEDVYAGARGPVGIVDLATGDVRPCNEASRAAFAGGIDPAITTRLRAGEPWRGEIGGRPALAFPLPGTGAGCVGIDTDGAELFGLLARHVRALETRMRRMEALQQVGLAVGRGMPLAQASLVALSRLEALLGTREGRVSLLEGDALRTVAAHRGGSVVTGEQRTLLSATPAGRARRAPLRHVVRAGEFPALATLAASGVRTSLFVPLRVEEAVLGYLELHAEDPDAFPPADADLAAEVARMLAGALLRERHVEQVTRHAQAMELRADSRHEELGRTQEQLIQAAKLSSIGELAAGLVHELNQPLNVLGGYVELLQEGSLGPDARARALELMSRAVTRMGTMVDNLRTFARGGGPTLSPIELAEVVAMARELTAGAHRRGVVVACPPGVRVLGDGNRLEQVLINLVANALQADGDPVSVTVRVEEDRALIEVSDRGPGVPEALRERIFDAFFTTKPPGLGTGLGLSVSARIVQEHGGRIEVADNPGGGAVFRVVLPVLRASG